ncbi:uncharacterized protein LOC130893231 [Diorhabda carinulata]|uniref:uncharacterized protein LOC130893231 n=1 Tax=Diorhabda carinulata TaxID=1163345 RepID=UPI0025A210E3|nr:uncharacterized protein LOC130893231 [Diorhabda carinulata]
MLFRILVLYTFFLHSFESFAISNDKDELSILQRAKRNLLCKEKEYLKNQPMSEQLRKFISRYKRKAKIPKSRIKHDIEDMYVLDNGNIVPLNQIKIRNVNEEYYTSSQASTQQWKFTVLPVILPKTRDSCSTVSTVESTSPVTTFSITTPSETTSIISATIDDTNTSSKIHKTTTKTEEKTEESYVESDDENIPSEVTTKGKLLSKVIQDVQELIKFENQPKTEGELGTCNVTGDWDSYAGGVQIRISPNSNPKTPKIEIVPREPPMDGFLNGTIWNVTALAPFPHQSLISITAVSAKGKKIANFLGECRICEGAESIAGYWMLRRKSKNCKDREEANSIISDVLRKNNVRLLQKQHLASIDKSTMQHIESTSEDVEH